MALPDFDGEATISKDVPSIVWLRKELEIWSDTTPIKAFGPSKRCFPTISLLRSKHKLWGVDITSVRQQEQEDKK